jgi:deoxyribose-phosphate aldolase
VRPCADALRQYGRDLHLAAFRRACARRPRQRHPVKIATVVNFPSGEMEVADVAAETREAIADGADEIDLVIPYRKFMAGSGRR